MKALKGSCAQNLDYQINRLGFSSVDGYKSGDAWVTAWWNLRGDRYVKMPPGDGQRTAIELPHRGSCLERPSYGGLGLMGGGKPRESHAPTVDQVDSRNDRSGQCSQVVCFIRGPGCTQGRVLPCERRRLSQQ